MPIYRGAEPGRKVTLRILHAIKRQKTKKLSRTEREQLTLQIWQFRLNMAQFIVGLVTSIIMAFATVYLAICTKQLSNETNALKISSLDQSRPYIFATSIERTADDNEFFFTMKNFGQTPAVDMKIDGFYFSLPIGNHRKSPIDADFDTNCTIDPRSDPNQLTSDPDSLSSGESTTDFLGYISPPPHPIPQNWEPDWGNGFTKKELSDFSMGKAAFIVMGIVCYKNLHHQQYYTKFCQIFGSPIALYSLGVDSTKLLTARGVHCNVGNDAD